MADSTSDLSDTIRDAAKTPKSASGDEGSFEARGIEELIAADQHLAAKRAANSPQRGLVLTKLSPPGSL